MRGGSGGYLRSIDDTEGERGGVLVGGQPFNVVSVVRAANPSGGCLGIASPTGRINTYLTRLCMQPR